MGTKVVVRNARYSWRIVVWVCVRRVSPEREIESEGTPRGELRHGYCIITNITLRNTFAQLPEIKKVDDTELAQETSLGGMYVAILLLWRHRAWNIGPTDVFSSDMPGIRHSVLICRQRLPMVGPPDQSNSDR